MATATVTGNLRDIGGAALVGQYPEIIFSPTGPSTKGGTIFATRPVIVIPAEDGSWSVSLEQTAGLIPRVWYYIQIRWLGSGGNYNYLDGLPRLDVPLGGGPIGELIGAVTDNDLVYVSAAAPVQGIYAGFQMNSISGDLFKRED